MSDIMLLDRDPALGALAGYAAEARRGEGRVVLVCGEAGVGKTSLLERFERDSREARWLWAACDGLFTPRPLGPVFDLANRLGGELLATVRSDAGREDVYAAMLRELGTFTVLVIEDMHWADAATIDLIHYLGRRVRDTRTLLVLTYRDDGLAVRHPLRQALGQLATTGATRRINLAPLSLAAVAQLAASSGHDPHELYRLTSGNPFFVSEVLKSGLGSLPESARDAVLARVAGLTPPALATLEVAALMGTRVEVPELTEVAGGAAIGELVTAGLLGGAPLGFRHEIARLAIEDSIPLYRRSGIHQRIVTGLKALGCSDDARLAHHAEAAGHPDTVGHARRAGQTAARLGSHREAAAQFERAIRFASDVDAAARAQLYEDFSVATSHLDRLEEAEAAGERALVLWRSVGEQLKVGTLQRRLARIKGYLCRGDDAMAAAEAAVATLEPLGPTPELAWAYATIAAQKMLHGDNASAIELALRAQAVGEEVNAVDAVSDALNTEAVSVSWLGGDGTEKMRRALDLALVGGHREQAARAYANFCSMFAQERRFAEAEKSISDGLAFCEEHQFTSYATFLHSMQANLLDSTGSWEQSAELSARVLAWAGVSPCNRICTLRRLGLLNGRLGRPDAWLLLDEALELAMSSGQPQERVAVGLARIEVHWLHDNVAAARREAEALVGYADRVDGWDRGLLALWLRRTGSAQVVAGRVARPCRSALSGRAAQAAHELLDLGCVHDAALVLFDEQDETSLRQALELFDRLGAARAAQLTRRRMRRLGIAKIPAGARSATRRHPLGLTEREREVLLLLHARKSNAQIAGTLLISIKTAGHHVSAILAKLGAPTRAAAVDEALRLGLLTPQA